VADILSGMSLKEKALIANMDEKSLPYLQYAFDVYLSQDVGDNPETGQEIMRRIWQTLQQTHRIRLVGKDG
jgi:predicted transcriptional regulator YdeE